MKYVVLTRRCPEHRKPNVHLHKEYLKEYVYVIWVGYRAASFVSISFKIYRVYRKVLYLIFIITSYVLKANTHTKTYCCQLQSFSNYA